MWYPVALTNPNFAMFVVVRLAFSMLFWVNWVVPLSSYIMLKMVNGLGSADSKSQKVPLG
jgi:hypothetical protein